MCNNNIIRNIYIFIIISLFTLTSCLPNNGEEKVATKTHFNIYIVSDLSNRVNNNLYPKPIQDTVIISAYIRSFDSVLHLGNRLINQKDRLHYEVVNNEFYNLMPSGITNNLKIDIARFDNAGKQAERIEYVKKSMASDLKRMSGDIDLFYDSAATHQYGADIWTYLNNFSPSIGINKSDTATIFNLEENQTIHNKISNILFLFTDGYIEAGLYGKGYDLGQKKVNAIRDEYHKSQMHNLDQFLDAHPEYSIKPLTNKELKNVNIIVMEAYDRSLSKSGSATSHPTDTEILKAAWNQWMKKSGVSIFEFHPFVNSIQEANSIFYKFLEKVQNNKTRF